MISDKVKIALLKAAPTLSHIDLIKLVIEECQQAQRQWVGLTDEEAHNVGERAEELIGYGHGAWDTRPLHEIVHAVLTAADEMRGIKGEA